MGWLYTKDATKSDIIADICRENSHVRTIKKRLSGNVLYSILETKKDGERFAMVCVLANDKGFGWGYKDMDEGVGPYYYDFPVKWLDELTPPRSEGAAEWRRNVRERAELTKRGQEILKAGKRFSLYGKEYDAEGDGKHAVRLDTEIPYRIPRKHWAFIVPA